MTSTVYDNRLILWCSKDVDTEYFHKNYCMKRDCDDCIIIKLSAKRLKTKLKEDIYIKSGTFIILEKEYADKE